MNLLLLVTTMNHVWNTLRRINRFLNGFRKQIPGTCWKQMRRYVNVIHDEHDGATAAWWTLMWVLQEPSVETCSSHCYDNMHLLIAWGLLWTTQGNSYICNLLASSCSAFQCPTHSSCSGSQKLHWCCSLTLKNMPTNTQLYSSCLSACSAYLIHD